MLRAHNLSEHAVEKATAKGFSAAPVLNFFLERYTPAYRRELDHFLAAVAGGQAPKPDGRDGLAAQRLADAATEATRSGRPQRL